MAERPACLPSNFPLLNIEPQKDALTSIGYFNFPYVDSIAWFLSLTRTGQLIPVVLACTLLCAAVNCLSSTLISHTYHLQHSTRTARTTTMKATRACLSSLSGAIPHAKQKYVPTSGTYPKGFAASGVFVGVKPGNTSKPDLALVTSDRPCAAAAVFTKNKFQAAPVTFSRKVLQDRGNAGLRSVVVNSGCANAVTGVGGLEDAASMARTTDQRVGSEDATLVMSTGVIGQRYVVASISIGETFRSIGDADECRPGFRSRRL